MSTAARTFNEANVIRLYRVLLKKSSNLKYTNKDFYTREVKKEFRKCQHEADIVKCQKQYDVSN